MDEITLRIGFEDGSYVDETISTDFTDLPPLVMYLILGAYPDDAAQMQAALVRAKLSDPGLVSQEMMVDLLDKIQRGEGIRLG